MNQQNNWDWDTGEKRIPIAGWEDAYIWVEELQVSVDGEKIDAIVAKDFGKWTIAINGKPWRIRFDELVIEPVFSPDSNSIEQRIKNVTEN